MFPLLGSKNAKSLILIYSNFGKKTIKYESIEKIAVKKEKKNIKLIPETNTNDNQVKIINNVWPISGWETKSNIIGMTISC